MSDAEVAAPAGADPGTAGLPPEDLDASTPTTAEEAEAAAAWDEFEKAESGDDDEPTAEETAAQESADDDAEVARLESEQNPPGEAPPATESAPPPADAADPFTSATPAQRAAWEAAQARLKSLEHADKSNRGRLSSLSRELNDLRQRKAADPQGSAPAAGSAQDFRQTDEWKAFVAEYPDVAGPLGKVLHMQGATIADTKKATDAYELEKVQRHEALIDANVAEVDKNVPDWRSVTGDPDKPDDPQEVAKLKAFRVWVEDQKADVRYAAYRNADEIVNPKEAATVLAAYKDFRSTQGGANNATQEPRRGAPAAEKTGNSLSSKRSLQLESSSAARTTGPGVQSGIAEDGDPQRIWDQFEESDRRKARRA